MAKRKLSEEQVQQIRCLNEARHRALKEAEFYSIRNIAERFGVSATVIHSVIEGYAYADVPDGSCKEET